MNGAKKNPHKLDSGTVQLERAVEVRRSKTGLVWRKQSRCQLNWHFKPWQPCSKQIAVMQSRMDAHDQVSDENPRLQCTSINSPCSKASAVQDTDAGRKLWHCRFVMKFLHPNGSCFPVPFLSVLKSRRRVKGRT